MSQSASTSLFELLPAIYRKRDEEFGGDLQILFNVFEQELVKIQDKISVTYNNCFIETCEAWVQPFIANLVGISNLKPRQYNLPYLRSFIANIVQYRNQKGQKAVLEKIIFDLTGWQANIIEYKPFLNITQNIHNISSGQGKLFDVRDREKNLKINTPFDKNGHTIDVRSIERYPAKYNINNIGIIIWRLPSYRLSGGKPKLISTGTGCYTFDPFGIDTPLFNYSVPSSQDNLENNQPNIITRAALQIDLASSKSDYYGSQQSLLILKYYADKNPIAVQVNEIIVMDLNNWSSVVVPKDKVAIDPCLGRFILGENHLTGLQDIEVNYCYGFSSGLGAGIYSQQTFFDLENNLQQQKFINKQIDLQKTIQASLVDTNLQGTVQIIITDNATYELANLTIAGNLSNIIIQAANNCRPCLQLNGNLIVNGTTKPLTVSLMGLYIDGTIELQGESQLNIANCTLVPKNSSPSIQASSVADTSSISIDHSITGALYLPSNIAGLNITDSIIDGLENVAIAADNAATHPGPFLQILRSTIFGSIYTVEIDQISDTIITQPITVNRTQYGCVRYSYLPMSSFTPPRFRCQPEFTFNELSQKYITTQQLDLKNGDTLSLYNKWTSSTLDSLSPVFIARNYGHPHYGMVDPQTNSGILQGAENGLEMGVYNQQYQPERKSVLQDIIDEYLPFGLASRTFFVT